jgi:hypothetical protein
MNKELRLELETRAQMETFKGGKATTGGGETHLSFFFHCGMPGIHMGVNKFCQ